MGFFKFLFGTKDNIDALESALHSLKQTHNFLSEITTELDALAETIAVEHSSSADLCDSSLVYSSINSSTPATLRPPPTRQPRVKFAPTVKPSSSPVNRQQTPGRALKRAYQPPQPKPEDEEEFDDVEFPSSPVIGSAIQHSPSITLENGQFHPADSGIAYDVHNMKWVAQQEEEDPFDGFSDSDQDDFSNIQSEGNLVPLPFQLPSKAVSDTKHLNDILSSRVN
ncbi:hypothetical protein P9112_008821 [Eukaryota sp. TZLM1-RC]